MNARLPSTRELLEALRPPPPAAGTPLRRLQWLFWSASLAALVLLAIALARRQAWHRPAPAWTVPALYILLGLSAAAGLVLLGRLLLRAWHRLRDPLALAAEQIDAGRAREDALLRSLGRVPHHALRARRRRVALQLRLWESTARMAALLLVSGPFALLLVSGALPLPQPGQNALPLLGGYGAACVALSALVLGVQRHCCQPLRRLAYVLEEAAEMREKVEARARA